MIAVRSPQALLAAASFAPRMLMIENVDPELLSPDNSRILETTDDLVTLLSQKVVGQSAATRAIVPYVYMYQSGLAPEERPAGVFLLLGPTGTGKTKTVEAI